MRVAVVEVTLEEGTVLSDRVDAVRGTPRNPMTRAEVVAKATDLLVPILGTEQSAQVVDTVFSIETLGSIQLLGALLRSV